MKVTPLIAITPKISIYLAKNYHTKIYYGHAARAFGLNDGK